MKQIWDHVFGGGARPQRDGLPSGKRYNLDDSRYLLLTETELWAVGDLMDDGPGTKNNIHGLSPNEGCIAGVVPAPVGAEAKLDKYAR